MTYFQFWNTFFAQLAATLLDYTFFLSNPTQMDLILLIPLVYMLGNKKFVVKFNKFLEFFAKVC